MFVVEAIKLPLYVKLSRQAFSQSSCRK